MASIEDLAQRLPQELKDLIHDFTFTADRARDGVREVNDQYRPPALLQINRAFRSQFVRSFYGNGISFEFVFKLPLDKVAQWCNALAPHDLALINHFRLPTEVVISQHTSATSSRTAGSIRCLARSQRFLASSASLRREAVYMGYYMDDGLHLRWTNDPVAIQGEVAALQAADGRCTVL